MSPTTPRSNIERRAETADIVLSTHQAPDLLEGREADTADKILNTSQAAKLLGRSEGAIRNLCLRKKIPHRKTAGRLVFFQSELINWVRKSPGVKLEDLEQ